MITLFSFVHLYGLLIGIGLCVAYMLIAKRMRDWKQPVALLDASLWWIAPAALIGARLYHLTTDAALYRGATLPDLLSVWQGGIGFLGALLGGMFGLACFVLIASKREKKAPVDLFFLLADALVMGIPVAQAIGRVGNFINHELYGMPTTLPWGIVIEGQRYHPLFAYEMMLDLLLFGILWLLSMRKSLVPGKGQYTALYLAGYGLIRFWLEFLRFDTARLSGTLGILSIAQWLTLCMMVCGTMLFWVRRHAPKKQWDWSLE